MNTDSRREGRVMAAMTHFLFGMPDQLAFVRAGSIRQANSASGCSDIVKMTQAVVCAQVHTLGSRRESVK
jgi:hypothetical protein